LIELTREAPCVLLGDRAVCVADIVGLPAHPTIASRFGEGATSAGASAECSVDGPDPSSTSGPAGRGATRCDEELSMATRMNAPRRMPAHDVERGRVPAQVGEVDRMPRAGAAGMPGGGGSDMNSAAACVPKRETTLTA
jgi:hypothetical protein